MDFKDTQNLFVKKGTAQHRPWWYVLLPKIAKRRSERARDEWNLYCKRLIMQAINFEDAWFVLCQCPSNGDARDICIVIAAMFTEEIREIDMVSAKAGLNPKHQQLIDSRRSEILAK